jgi:hypothetical protein
MATGTAGSTARRTTDQHIHYLRKAITYLDDGLTVNVGTLPAGAQIIKPISGVAVNVAFNGGSTNTLDIGRSTDTGTNDLATILALGTIGFIPIDEVVSNLISTDTLIQAKVVSTATASAGSGVIIIAYALDNDG